MNTLHIKSFGQIGEANIKFGDLTLLVGQQASGKSIVLQLLKLLIDKKNIEETLLQYSYTWGRKADLFLDMYFGEGMHKIWSDDSEVIFDDKAYRKEEFVSAEGNTTEKKSVHQESLLYFPAHRILSVSDGRPKNFMEFDITTPYVFRNFSETLRLFFQREMSGKYKQVFPLDSRLGEPLVQSLRDSIFPNGTIYVDEDKGRKILKMKVATMNVLFTTWSTGQKEFMPLLMGFYILSPSAKYSRHQTYKYVVLEEPEIGLHPQAIQSVILQVLSLLTKGYKVIISTHSPVLLEFAWAFNLLKESRVDDSAFIELFDVPDTSDSRQLFGGLLSGKTISTYFFGRENNTTIVKDITSLDVGSEDEAISHWGGLSQFSGKVTDVVSKLYKEGE